MALPDTMSVLIESDVPIVVQHTRLDSGRAENALLSTIAFAVIQKTTRSSCRSYDGVGVARSRGTMGYDPVPAARA